MPTISVIVPVYKVEAYLDRCVQSILNQTYIDFELILVDDGSPDRCGAICDAWAEKDSRIRVIHKQNGGLSDARNAGIEIAEGKYLTFVDSDDYIHPKMLEALYGAVREHGVKLSVCGFAQTNGEPLETEQMPVKLWASRAFYRGNTLNATVAWGKLYHADVVRPYPVGKIHEDEYVSYRIFYALDTVAFVDAPLYGYFQNNTGITKSRWSPRKMDGWVAMEQQIAFFQEENDLKAARGRVQALWWVVVDQMEQIQEASTGAERTRYLRSCRQQLRRVWKRNRLLMRFNWLDHADMYIKAWPGRTLFVKIYRGIKSFGHRLLRRQ